MPKTISVRIEDDLTVAVDQWLQKHPDLTMTVITNMALRKFVTQPHVLDPVETVTASKADVNKAIKQSMSEHSDMLERLK